MTEKDRKRGSSDTIRQTCPGHMARVKILKTMIELVRNPRNVLPVWTCLVVSFFGLYFVVVCLFVFVRCGDTAESWQNLQH